MNTDIDKILARLEEDLSNNRLVLPTLPEVALSVRDAVENPNANVADIARIVSTDAALSARLLQVANSPLYRTRTPVENLQTAITRLGSIQVRNLVTSLVMQQMFRATNDALNLHMRTVWEHSTHVASLSYLVAEQAGLQKDHAMLAGLIHDVGVLPILVQADSMPELTGSADVLETVVKELHTRIGKIVLENWGFAQSLVDVATCHEDLYRDASGPVDYVDVVIVANLESLRNTKHPYAKLDWSGIPAFRKLGIDPGVPVTENQGNRERMQEVQSLLQ